MGRANGMHCIGENIGSMYFLPIAVPAKMKTRLSNNGVYSLSKRPRIRMESVVKS